MTLQTPACFLEQALTLTDFIGMIFSLTEIVALHGLITHFEDCFTNVLKNLLL